jgi:hypothetical protein
VCLPVVSRCVCNFRCRARKKSRWRSFAYSSLLGVQYLYYSMGFPARASIPQKSRERVLNKTSQIALSLSNSRFLLKFSTGILRFHVVMTSVSSLLSQKLEESFDGFHAPCPLKCSMYIVLNLTDGVMIAMFRCSFFFVSPYLVGVIATVSG